MGWNGYIYIYYTCATLRLSRSQESHHTMMRNMRMNTDNTMNKKIPPSMGGSQDMLNISLASLSAFMLGHIFK